MVTTLNSLSEQEAKLYTIAEELEGSMEVKEQWLKEAGVFSEYTILHSKYLEFLGQTDNLSLKLEALKRLVFLNWYQYSEPSIYTGIYELDTTVVAASFSLLNTYITDHLLDHEFQWMLSYYSCWDYTILPYSELHLPALTNFVKAVDTSVLHVPKHLLPRGTMDNRGQMGHYWRSCSVEAKAE